MPPLSRPPKTFATIVIDANLAAALVLDLEFSELTSQVWRQWQTSTTAVFAPQLWLYELATILRKAVALGGIQAQTAEEALVAALQLGVTIVDADEDQCRSALRWAERLGQTAAYDSFYLALASRLQADFWSADRRLVNAARQAGLRWAHWVGELEVDAS